MTEETTPDEPEQETPEEETPQDNNDGILELQEEEVFDVRIEIVSRVLTRQINSAGGSVIARQKEVVVIKILNGLELLEYVEDESILTGNEGASFLIEGVPYLIERLDVNEIGVYTAELSRFAN